MKRILGLLWAVAVAIAPQAAIVNTINSVADLQALAVSVNGGTDDYTGKTVTLCWDLDLADVDWTPIGTSEHPFMGTFDGQGYTIRNLHVNTTAVAAGLFGFVGAGGVVKDVNIDSSTGTISITGDHGVETLCLGAVVGHNAGQVVGCSNAMPVSGASYDHARVGGIVGTNTGSIENCYNLGTVYTSLSNVYIGGLVGYNGGAVRNCWTRCTVQANGDSKAYPFYGNNGGTVTGCFYAGGTDADALGAEPVVLANAWDNSTTLSENDNASGKNVLLDSRTLLANGDWNTLCLPFSIPASGNGRSPIAGATVKEFTSAALNDTRDHLHVGFTEVTAIEAGKPYLVKWSTGVNIVNPMFLNVTISATAPATVSLLNGDVQFAGTLSPTQLTNDGTQLFVGTGNQIHYPSSANYSLKSCRAYFNVNWTIAAGARLEMAFMDDETTAIGTVTHYRATSDDAWYTLDGRPVTPGHGSGVLIRRSQVVAMPHR